MDNIAVTPLLSEQVQHAASELKNTHAEYYTDDIVDHTQIVNWDSTSIINGPFIDTDIIDLEFDNISLNNDYTYNEDYDNYHAYGDDDGYGVSSTTEFHDYFNQTPLTTISESGSDSGDGGDVTQHNLLEVAKQLDAIDDCKKRVLNSIPPEYNFLHVIVLCRIYLPEKGKFKYVIEFAKNLKKLLCKIDETYACEWDIEILTLKESKSQNSEIIEKYYIYRRLGITIVENTYDINEQIFIYCKKNANYVNPFYSFIDGTEAYLGKTITDSDSTRNNFI
jgi:hypothetical protein